MMAALASFGAPTAALGVTQQDFERPDVVVQIGIPPRRIDLLTGVSGLAFDDAWPNRVVVEWEGREICFLGLDDLLRYKRSTGRDKDLLDVAELERRRAEDGPVRRSSTSNDQGSNDPGSNDPGSNDPGRTS
ncbi:MAG: hypothetical protein ACE37K_19710 [Planctomycetota bacterium]